MILVLCAMLTAILLFFIFGMEEPAEVSPEKTRLLYLYERRDVVYENLRDLNFEFKAGKFPETDYEAMRAQIEDEAAQVLAEIDQIEQQNLKGAQA